MPIRSRLALAVVLVLALASAFALPRNAGGTAAVVTVTRPDGQVQVKVLPISGTARTVATFAAGSALLGVRGDTALMGIAGGVIRLNLSTGASQKFVVPGATAIGPLAGLSEDGKSAAIDVALTGGVVDVDIVNFDSNTLRKLAVPADKLGYTVALGDSGPLLLRQPAFVYVDGGSGRVTTVINAPSNTLGAEFSPSGSWIATPVNIAGLADHYQVGATGTPFANGLIEYQANNSHGKTVFSMAFHDLRPMSVDDSGNVLSGDASVTSNGTSLPLHLVIVHSDGSVTQLPTPQNLSRVISGALVSDSSAILVTVDNAGAGSGVAAATNYTVSYVSAGGENRVIGHFQSAGTPSGLFAASA